MTAFHRIDIKLKVGLRRPSRARVKSSRVWKRSWRIFQEKTAKGQLPSVDASPERKNKMSVQDAVVAAVGVAFALAIYRHLTASPAQRAAGMAQVEADQADWNRLWRQTIRTNTCIAQYGMSYRCF